MSALTTVDPGLRPQPDGTGSSTGAGSTPSACDGYLALMEQVQQAGLLERRSRYYVAKISLTLIGFGLAWAVFVIVGNSWATLGVAVLLAVAFAQVVFLGHDAGHRQISGSRRTNRLIGLLVGNALTGLNYGWWVSKHDAHHAHPNQPGHDPDLGGGIVGFGPVDATRDQSLALRLRARCQAWLFVVVLLLQGAGLHVTSVQSVLRRRDRRAVTEGLLLLGNAAAFLAVVFWVLPPSKAFAFGFLQQGLFGLYLGCTFAPNHKGMPVLDHDATMSFPRRQVVTARNVTGGRLTTFVLGGLDYQIEHHLFPRMPRPNLRRAQGMVQAFCAEHGLPYRQERPLASYRQAFGHTATGDPATGDPPTVPAIARPPAGHGPSWSAAR